MAMNEIGSDFYDLERTNTEFFLSGRTAEEYIIRDILETQVIESALLPSFCCHTMIEPFQRHGIPVRFYDVIFDDKLKIRLPEKREGEVLLYLDYFGYSRITGLENVNDWDVTIEDCTHSWMSGKTSDADYSFVSYRKWSGFTAIARADKKNGRFLIMQKDRQNLPFENHRKMAMRLKKDFLEHKVGCKQDYFAQFQWAEEKLEADYVGYRPTYDSLMRLLSLDTAAIKAKRRRNAQVIYDALREVNGIKFMFPNISESDVPFHVPVLIENRLRNKLRKYLIDNRIYCPIHWPLSVFHTISAEAKEIYDKELSFVCDQRYGRKDMEREALVIKDFFRC